MNTKPPYPAPEGFKTIQVSFPRQCQKRELKEAFDEYDQLGFEIGSEAHKHFEEAMQKFARETLPPFASAIRGLFQTIEGTWTNIQPSIKVLEQWAADMDHKPVHPKDIRDARGVKQPSPVPPFWAARPNGRRR